MRSWSVDQNADIDWDEFDTEAYYSHNYRALRNDDRQIVELVRDYFSHAFEVGLLGTGGRGIDVGTGPNLYPALTMLPFCAELTLFERATSNISWLTRQKEDSWPSWDESWHQFWEVLRGQSVYRRFDEPRNALVDRTRVVRGNLYKMRTVKAYDVGTMCFVAESITGQESEFRSAMDHFFDVLRPGAPFAVTFMEHSAGYQVADRYFPAIDIDDTAVKNCLDGRTTEHSIEHIDTGDNPLRDGYTGMLVALGRTSTEDGKALT